jgi:transcriptional regulator with XRE-family HTH domain
MAKKRKAKTTMARSANAEDALVGQRIRAARLTADISQEHLGERLGVSFQQVQKYEKGVNRVSAGRLRQVAEILDKPLSYFFESTVKHSRDPSGLDALLASREVIDLLKVLAAIEDPAKRRVVYNCALQIATAIESS